MSFNAKWDSLEFEKLYFPYSRIEAELSSTPRFIRGNDTVVSYGGKLQKRPGNTLLAGSVIGGKRIDRLFVYETLDTPAKVYLIASMFDTTLQNWGLFWLRESSVSPGWTAFSNIRQIQASTRPHEAVVSRGLLYCKGFPTAASGETLGTVLFDGSGAGTPVTKFWVYCRQRRQRRL